MRVGEALDGAEPPSGGPAAGVAPAAPRVAAPAGVVALAGWRCWSAAPAVPRAGGTRRWLGACVCWPAVVVDLVGCCCCWAGAPGAAGAADTRGCAGRCPGLHHRGAATLPGRTGCTGTGAVRRVSGVVEPTPRRVPGRATARTKRIASVPTRPTKPVRKRASKELGRVKTGAGPAAAVPSPRPVPSLRPEPSARPGVARPSTAVPPVVPVSGTVAPVMRASSRGSRCGRSRGARSAGSRSRR